MNSVVSNYNVMTCHIEVVKKKSGEQIFFKECISCEVKKSYDTLTNTAEITLPKDNRWIVNDDDGYNRREILSDNNEAIFETGDSIHIQLGYDFNNVSVFRGYITGITPQAPFTIKCEDAMWKLKQNRLSISKRKKEGNKLSEFVDELLEGTGVEIHPDTNTKEIEFGKIYISNISTAALLAEWKNKFGLLSFIKDDKLMIGRTFFSSSSNVFKTSDSPDYEPPVYNVEFDVEEGLDNLIINKLSAKLLALKAISTLSNNHRLELTVILDPKDSNERNIIVIEEKDTRLSKDQNKARNNEIIKGLGGVPLFTSNYQTNTLHEYNLEKEALLEAAKGVFFRYVDTAFEGNIGFFGDYNLEPAESIILLDPRNAEKNGEFLPKNLTVRFSEYGLRYTVDLPHKVKSIKVNNNQIANVDE